MVSYCNCKDPNCSLVDLRVKVGRHPSLDFGPTNAHHETRDGIAQLNRPVHFYLSAWVGGVGRNNLQSVLSIIGEHGRPWGEMGCTAGAIFLEPGLLTCRYAQT